MLPGSLWACAAVATLFVAGAHAAGLAIPISWRNTDLNVSQSEINALTRRAIDSLIRQIDPASGIVNALTMSGTYIMLATISHTDHLNGTTTFQTEVLRALDNVFAHGIPTHDQAIEANEDLGFLGLATYHAWQAYKDVKSFNRTVQVWETLNTYVVSPLEASTGHSRTRRVPIAPICGDSTTAGGVFASRGVGSFDTQVTGKSTGAFLTLSALLYKATFDTTFGNAAQTSATFIRNHLFNGTIVFNEISLSNCKPTAAPLLSSSSGLFIEGMAHLARHDSSWYSELELVVSQAVQFPAWTNQLGIQDEPKANILRGILPRALSITHMQANSPSLAKFVQSYLNIQFNSLNNPILRSRDQLSEDAPSQLHMAAVGSAVIGRSNAVSADPSCKGQGRDSHGGSHGDSCNGHGGSLRQGLSKAEVGIIVGGTIGGVAALLLLFIGGLLFWRRYSQRRRRQQISTSQYRRSSRSLYGPSSTGVLSTIILPPATDRTSRSRTTIITSQFYPPILEPTSAHWNMPEQAGPMVVTSENRQAQKVDTHLNGWKPICRSVTFSKTAAQTTPLPPDENPREELDDTTMLNRIVTRLALGGHASSVTVAKTLKNVDA